MTQTETLDMIAKLQLAGQTMESACERIDQLKAENKALKDELMQSKRLYTKDDLRAEYKRGLKEGNDYQYDPQW